MKKDDLKISLDELMKEIENYKNKRQFGQQFFTQEQMEFIDKAREGEYPLPWRKIRDLMRKAWSDGIPRGHCTLMEKYQRSQQYYDGLSRKNRNVK